MPDLSSFFSKFLKAEDLKEGPRTLTIKNVAEQEVGKDDKKEPKLVMTFDEDDRGCTLGSVRYEQATEIFSSKNTDVWIGKKIQLVFDPSVKYAGKRVGGIAFRAAV
jgi:hypothetical protein